jgi:hypothetical protein
LRVILRKLGSVVLPLVNPFLIETYAPSFIIQNLVYTILWPSPCAGPGWERTLVSAAE